MRRMKTLALFAAILMVALTAFGCRTRVRDRATPQTAPTTDTTPSVTVTPPTSIAEPDDFVQPQITEEAIPADITEANRVAQERGWIRDAFFPFDESTLTADAQEALTVSAQWLRANPQFALTIEGHCDERGTEQYNLALGDRRANVARDYLVTLGIDPRRIRTVSYGEERPFRTGSNEAAWAQNRRAHLVLTR
jgi:peptidoglycan-associated lipoprotein